MGTPAFAVPSLVALDGCHDVVEVVTQPDRPVGRGRKVSSPPVKRTALQLGLSVYQPERIRAPDAAARIAAADPEVIAVVGYGQMIPRSIRDLPPLGCVNVHSSLLPKYRGAAPVNWAIVRGENRTGVTTMRIARAMDAGDILLARETSIGPLETAAGLGGRLAPMGADLLLETLEGLSEGRLRGTPQDHAAATRAPLIRRSDGLVDWRLPASEIFNRLRGFDPWPGIFTFFRGRRLRVHEARVSGGGQLPPGELRLHGNNLLAGCGSGNLVLETVQVEGRRRVAGSDFARGARLAGREVLEDG